MDGHDPGRLLQIEQVDQKVGGKEHMVARVFFSLERDGEVEGQFASDVKQTVGDTFATGAIEVTPPFGYDRRPFSHAKFSEAASDYCSLPVRSQRYRQHWT